MIKWERIAEGRAARLGALVLVVAPAGDSAWGEVRVGFGSLYVNAGYVGDVATGQRAAENLARWLAGPGQGILAAALGAGSNYVPGDGSAAVRS